MTHAIPRCDLVLEAGRQASSAASAPCRRLAHPRAAARSPRSSATTAPASPRWSAACSAIHRPDERRHRLRRRGASDFHSPEDGPQGRHRDRAPEPRAGRGPHRLAEPLPQPRDRPRVRAASPARPARRCGARRARCVATWRSTCPRSTPGCAGCPAASARPSRSAARPASAPARHHGRADGRARRPGDRAGRGAHPAAARRGARGPAHQPQLRAGHAAERAGLGDARRPLRRRTPYAETTGERDRRPDHRRHRRRRLTITGRRGGPVRCQPLGVHALVWVGDTSPAAVASRDPQTAEAGYDLLEIPLHDSVNLDAAAPARGAATTPASASPARAASPSTPTSPATTPPWSQRGEKLLHDSLAGHRRARRHALHRRALQRAGQVRPPRSPSRARQRREVLRGLATNAGRRGMTLGLEICNRYETNVINTADQALAARRRHRRGQRHRPPRHLPHEHRGGRTCPRRSRPVGDRLGLRPHRREPPRLPRLRAPGLHLGRSPRSTGSATTGPITFESFSSAVVSPALSNDLGIWRNLGRRRGPGTVGPAFVAEPAAPPATA